MKIKTNLTPNQLDRVAKGIRVAADSQRERKYVPENPAEAELVRRTDNALKTMLDNLQDEIANILLDKE